MQIDIKKFDLLPSPDIWSPLHAGFRRFDNLWAHCPWIRSDRSHAMHLSFGIRPKVMVRFNYGAFAPKDKF